MNDADTYSEFVNEWCRYIFSICFTNIGWEIWPLDCALYVSKLWPCDLVLNIFLCLGDTFVIDFHEGWMKSVASRVFTMCFFRNWLGDLVFHPTWHSFRIDRYIMEINFLILFMKIWWTTWHLECSQWFFSKIWRSNPTWPSSGISLRRLI